MKEGDSERKKVAIFLPSLMGGGAEKVMVILANSLIERGISVDLVLVNATGPYLKNVDSKVNVVNLDSARQITSLIPLINYIKSQKPKIMLSVLTSANIIAIFARIFSRTSFKLVISERAVTSLAVKDNKLLIAKVFPFLMRLAYPFADAIVAVANGVKRDLIQNYKVPGNKIKVIYNPVVTDELISLSQEEFYHQWFQDNNVPVIVAVGRLTSQKNFKLLINAFAKVSEILDSRLVILGEGEMRGELEALVDDLNIGSKVELPGFAGNPYVWLKNASLFVLSSDYEGLPGTLIQAMACGVPVVSTNCPSGPDEILENGKWGRLVPTGNLSALETAIIQTLQDKKHPDVKFRAKFFSIKNATDAYIEVLGLNVNN